MESEIRASPSSALRFVIRDGKHILQQRWEVGISKSDGSCEGYEEWRDVELVTSAGVGLVDMKEYDWDNVRVTVTDE